MVKDSRTYVYRWFKDGKRLIMVQSYEMMQDQEVMLEKISYISEMNGIVVAREGEFIFDKSAGEYVSIKKNEG